MSRLQLFSFAVAALSFVAWLITVFTSEFVGHSALLWIALAFLLVGFGSLMIKYARAVAPEWGDNDG